MDTQLLIGILLGLPAPIVFATIVFVLSSRRVSSPGSGTGGDGAGGGSTSNESLWLTAVAFAGAFLIGFAHRKIGGFGFPPKDSSGWLAYAAAWSVVAGVAAHAARGSLVGSWVVRLAFSIAVVGALGTRKYASWSGAEAALWIGAYASALALAWGSLDRLSRGTRAVDGSSSGFAARAIVPAWSVPLTFTAWIALCSQALVATDSLKLGEASGFLAAACGSALLVAIVRPSLILTGGGSAAIAIILGALLFNGHHFSGLKLWMMILLILAPVLAATLDFTLFAGITGWKRALARLAALVALPMVVLAVAIPAAMKAAADTGY